MKYVFLILFVAVMIAVGIYSKKKVNNINDFLLAGRNVGPWISAFAYGTTYFSAVIFIGYAGSVGWNYGISATWVGIGNAILGCLLAWLVLAKKTRKMTHDLDASTMPEFFEKRYGSRALKIATSIIIFIFLVPYTASVYSGLSYLFSKAFDVPYEYCMLAMAILTGVYLLLGGYVATAINDFIQGIIMLVGLVLMVFFIVGHEKVGGLSAGLNTLASYDDNLVKVFSGQPMNLLGLVILTSLGTWGLPQMIHKFYAVRDEDAIKKGTIISTIFAIIISGGAYFSGVFGRLFLDNQKPAVMDTVMPDVLSMALPDWMMGIIIILVLSASMSTLSGLVLISSSAISMDLLKGSLFPKMKKETVMTLMRVLCAVFVALSFAIAVTKISAIITLMSLSWGTIAGAFLAPFLYGLYWKGVTKAGAWAGVISGIVCSIGGFFYFGMKASLAPNIGAVAMLVSLVVVPVVSLLTPKLPEEHLQKVFIDQPKDDKVYSKLNPNNVGSEA